MLFLSPSTDNEDARIGGHRAVADNGVRLTASADSSVDGVM
jgi:hypothetical protein